MAVSLQYKGYFLRLILPGSHSNLPSCVLVQISKSEDGKPFVELYDSSKHGLVSGVHWIDRELPQLTDADQNFERPQTVQNILTAEKLKAEIKSSIADTQHVIAEAEHMLALSRTLSALTRSH